MNYKQPKLLENKEKILNPKETKDTNDTLEGRGAFIETKNLIVLYGKAEDCLTCRK